MANNNQQQPGKTSAGTSIQHVKQQNAQAAQGFGTEFASETNMQQVKKQAQPNAQASQGQAGQQFGTEFASETEVQKVKKQNQQAEANKSQNS